MLVNHAAFEEGMRHQRVTSYTIMPRQASEQADYQVLVENIPSVFEEDLRMIQNKEEIPFWIEEKGKAWAKLAKLKVSTPQLLFAMSGNPSDKSKSNGENTFEFFDSFEDAIYTHANNPLLSVGAPGEFDDEGVYDPSILKVGETYYLYYSAYPGTQIITEGLATSPDGIVWTKQGKVLDVGAANDWDDLKAHDVAVMKDGATWYMWYSGTRDAEATYGLKIGLATSSNGTSWTKNSGCANCSGCAGDGCVFDKGAAGKFDDEHVVYPAVIKEGSTYYMWYSGAKSGSGYSGIGLATSTDGINWTRQNSGDAVFTKNASYAWEASFVYSADVQKIGDKYWMVYTGYSGSVYRLGLAYSTDKENWTRHPDNPILSLGASGEWDEERHVTGGFYNYDYPTVRLYYTGYDVANSDQKIGLAIIPDLESVGIKSLWTQVNGPTIEKSLTQKRSGASSLHLHDTITPSAHVSKTASGAKRIVAWLYDDSADTTSLQMLRMRSGAAVLVAVGVYTGQSTTHYVYQDASYHTTSVTRTTSWHKLEAVADGATWDLFIDGTAIASNVGTTTGFAEFWLDVSWSYPSHGYYDDVFVAEYASPEPLILKKRVSCKADVIRAIAAGLVA